MWSRRLRPAELPWARITSSAVRCSCAPASAVPLGTKSSTTSSMSLAMWASSLMELAVPDHAAGRLWAVNRAPKWDWVRAVSAVLPAPVEPVTHTVRWESGNGALQAAASTGTVTWSGATSSRVSAAHTASRSASVLVGRSG